MISVLILTLNEERNLPGCLESVCWSDDIVVFDSFSTDGTLALARAAGARVIQRRFDNYGAQREAARVSYGFKNRWVLALDADERPDAELVGEMRRVAAGNGGGPAAYRLRRKDHFCGRWLRHASLYPTWFVRFFQPARVRYGDRAVHEYPVVSGSMGELRGHLLHYSFNKGLEEWRQKHARYAALEAAENLRVLRRGGVDWRGLLSAEPPARRRALKELAMRLPGRAGLRFLYMYLLRLGILDGAAGFHYCRWLAAYEGMVVRELKRLKVES